MKIKFKLKNIFFKSLVTSSFKFGFLENGIDENKIYARFYE